jgi:hypothetical protein
MSRLTEFHHQHRSTTTRSEVFRRIHHEDNEEEEEEERFVRLERRLVLNVEGPIRRTREGGGVNGSR